MLVCVRLPVIQIRFYCSVHFIKKSWKLISQPSNYFISKEVKEISEIPPAISSALISNFQCPFTDQTSCCFSLILHVFTDLNKIWIIAVSSAFPTPMFFLSTNKGKASAAEKSRWDQRRICSSPTSTPYLQRHRSPPPREQRKERRGKVNHSSWVLSWFYSLWKWQDEVKHLIA